MSVITPEATAALYAEARERVVHLVQDIDGDTARQQVPGTPEWTVHDVVAHLAAIPSDIAAGRRKSIPGPDDTRRQVEARRSAPMRELLDEWSEHAPAIVELARAGLIPAPLAIDAITHEQDLRGALRAAHLADDAALRFAVTGYSLGVAHRIKRAELPPLRLCDPARGFDATCGDGEPAATVSASEFELFRAVAGRRSRAQVTDFDWTGDRTPYLEVLCVFGPLPAMDVSD
jgi:uncharacterized protein (TIGR03083 family)